MAPESEIDKYNKRHSTINYATGKGDISLTEEQEKVRELISDVFLKMCITETFGIREGIMNLMGTFDFLVLAKTRGVLDQLPPLNNPNNIEETTNEDGSGEINLQFDLIKDADDNYQALTLLKKRDVEIKKEKEESKGKKESVLNLVRD